jgi:hypothetical protein
VRDQHVDLRKQVALARVERVVEVEDPGADVAQRTRRRGEGVHGRANMALFGGEFINATVAMNEP